MKIGKETWLGLKQAFPNTFDGLWHPRTLRRLKIESLSAKLEVIAEKSSDPALLRRMIDCVCVFMLRPVIRHNASVEYDFEKRREIGKIMQKTSPLLYKSYSSNKLRKRHVQDALGIVNWYVNDDRPVPQKVLLAKRDLERNLNIKKRDHLPLYDLMSFGDKMLIIRKVEIYLMAVVKWCVEYETSQLKQKKVFVVEKENAFVFDS